MPASNTGKAEKRKKKSQKEDDVLPDRKRKKRKLDKVVNWGETEVDEELDVRSWLLKDAAKDDIANGMKDAEKTRLTSGRTGEEARVMKTMKQLELSWKRHMNKEEIKEGATEEPT